MSLRSRSSLSLVALVAALAGCDAPGPCRLDGPPTGVVSTRVFWVSALDIPLADGIAIPGLDLDGIATEGTELACPFDPDHVSRLGDGDGVDNALATFAETIEANWSPPGTFSAELAAAMRAGAIRLAIVLEEDGVSTCGGATYTVRLRRVERIDGMPIAVGEDGMPLAGQPLSLGEELAAGRAPIEGRRVRGRIVGDAAIAMDPSSVRVPLGALATMEPGGIAFDVGVDTLARGVIAGSWETDALVPEVAAGFPDEPGIDETVRALVEGIADLGAARPDGSCSRFSAGITFEARAIALSE